MLKDRFSTYNSAKLIEIIELPDAYTNEAREIAEDILLERNLHPNSLDKLVKDFWYNYIKENFRHLLKTGERIQSKYLSQEELKPLFQRAYNRYKHRQELFEIDLQLYWGAAL